MSHRTCRWRRCSCAPWTRCSGRRSRRTEPVKPSPPATPDELLSIGERALALWGSLDLDSEVSDAQQERRFWLYRSAVEAVRLCAAAGRSACDVALLPIITRGIQFLDVSPLDDDDD